MKEGRKSENDGSDTRGNKDALKQGRNNSTPEGETD